MCPLKYVSETKTVHRDGRGVDVTVVSRGRQEGGRGGVKGTSHEAYMP